MPSREELRKSIKTQWCQQQKWEYPEKQGYAPADAQGGKASLKPHTPLSHCAPANVLSKGIRSVATILERGAAVQAADMIITNMMGRLDPILVLMDHAERLHKTPLRAPELP